MFFFSEKVSGFELILLTVLVAVVTLYILGFKRLNNSPRMVKIVRQSEKHSRMWLAYLVVF